MKYNFVFLFTMALCAVLSAQELSLGAFNLSRPAYLGIDNINLRKVYITGAGEECTLGTTENLQGDVSRQVGEKGGTLHQSYQVRLGEVGEILTVDENYALLENGNLSWECRISSDREDSVLLRHGNRFSMDLSSLALILNGMTVDGRTMKFEQQLGLGAPLSGRLPNYREISTIRPHGTLKIFGSGKDEAFWIDHRVVGNNEISLRFPFQTQGDDSIVLSLEFGYEPGEIAFAARPFFLHENDEWKPVSRKALKTVMPGSILDFSFLQDKPAGKYGFLRSVDDHFEFEGRPGVPVRFWGSNICFTMNFCSHEEADSLADQVAALGFNIVRFHHYDNGLAVQVDGHNVGIDLEKKDRMNYLVYAFKKRGIYVNLDFYTYRVPSATDLAEAPNAGRNKEITKSMIYMSDTGFEFYKAFILNLMSEVNPYTGMAWKDDPSLVSVCLVNEGNIHEVVSTALSGKCGELVRQRFDALAASRKWDLEGGRRDAYFRRFVLESYRDFYKKTTAMLQENGIKLLVSDQNMISTPELALMRNDYDFVENHYYLNHPELIGIGWNLPERVRHVKMSNSWDSALHCMGPSRISGKPFAVTEWDFSRPCPFATEGGLAMGAFSSLQDWNMINHFSIAGDSERALGSESKLSNFDIMNDPPRMFSDRIGSALFLRGDVQKAKNAYAILVPEELYGTPEFCNGFPALIYRLTSLSMTGSIVTSNRGPLPPNLRAVFGYTDKPGCDLGGVPYFKLKPEDFQGSAIRDRIPELIKAGILDDGIFDMEKAKYTSDTGEICIDHSNDLFSVITPRTEGFSIMPGHEAQGNFLGVSEITRYCVVAATSYDGLPLAESRRVMISHLTEMVNDNTRFRDDGNMNVVEDWGSSTALLHLGKARITLAVKYNDRPRLFACDLSGERLYEIPFELNDGTLSFTADNYMDGKAILTYELLRQ